MPDPKVTPQIQKAAIEIAEWVRDNPYWWEKYSGNQVKEIFANCICHYTGAEMMPEMYKELEWRQDNDDRHARYRCSYCGSTSHSDCKDTCILTRLSELGYGKEGE